MKRTQHKSETGRSMVEMLGVLAIIGVLSVGGIAGYKLAIEKYAGTHVATLVSRLLVALKAESFNPDTPFKLSGNFADHPVSANNMIKLNRYFCENYLGEEFCHLSDKKSWGSDTYTRSYIHFPRPSDMSWTLTNEKGDDGLIKLYFFMSPSVCREVVTRIFSEGGDDLYAVSFDGSIRSQGFELNTALDHICSETTQKEDHSPTHKPYIWQMQAIFYSDAELN